MGSSRHSQLACSPLSRYEWRDRRPIHPSLHARRPKGAAAEAPPAPRPPPSASATTMLALTCVAPQCAVRSTAPRGWATGQNRALTAATTCSAHTFAPLLRAPPTRALPVVRCQASSSSSTAAPAKGTRAVVIGELVCTVTVGALAVPPSHSHLVGPAQSPPVIITTGHHHPAHPSSASSTTCAGAGLAGLTAAKALAPHFESVTVLERDAWTANVAEGTDHRPGVPQFQQPHVLLARGLQASTFTGKGHGRAEWQAGCPQRQDT